MTAVTTILASLELPRIRRHGVTPPAEQGGESIGEKRGKYTQGFKAEAVRFLNSSGKSGHDIEHDLGVGVGTTYRWRMQPEGEPRGLRAFPGNGNPREEELARLRKENAILCEARDILRKATVI